MPKTSSSRGWKGRKVHSYFDDDECKIETSENYGTDRGHYLKVFVDDSGPIFFVRDDQPGDEQFDTIYSTAAVQISKEDLSLLLEWLGKACL